MPQKISMWEISEQNTLNEISSSEINLEERLEDWLESNISILGPDLLVIGRQVRTDFGGEIDLLCLDASGAVVVVELKKGQTPREVTAQALDYASWVKDLSYQRIEDLAQNYLEGSLDEAFNTKFEVELPDTLNESHRSLIVAEAMDASTERIVRYLSDLKVPINVATVQHFRASDGREMLAQVFLIEPEAAAAGLQASSKRRTTNATVAELQRLAEENGVSQLYLQIRNGIGGIFLSTVFGRTKLGIQVRRENRSLAVLILDLEESGCDQGLRFRLNGSRMMSHFELDVQEIEKLLPANYEEMPVTEWQQATEDEINNWNGYKGFFRTTTEIDKFLSSLRQRGA